MIYDLHVGRALRRFRLLNGIKQGHVAELLHVSQGSVSRWESGAHEPDAAHRERIAAIIAARANNDGDAALKRLVSTSLNAVHLICDATHRLLAASPTRKTSWKVNAEPFFGTSLWPFATAEIVAAEAELGKRGWFERPWQTFGFETAGNSGADMTVEPGVVRWETIALADGRVGRLTTTIP